MDDPWTTGIEPVNGAGNIYANLVDAFAAVLPAPPAAKLATAREVARLLARSIVCADRVIDRDGSHADQARNVLAAQICQYEATCLLRGLISHDHPLWAEISCRLREFAEACTVESSASPTHTWTIDAAEHIAMGKNALARITGPLVCAIAPSPTLIPVFDRAIVDLIITVQSLDDAMDWRIDLAARQVSLITARVWSRFAAGSHAEVDSFVHREAIPQVLRQGRDALADAMAIRELDASESWRRLVERISSGYQRIFAMWQ